jgi:tetratricopeptide (TPR) repeat protein
MRGWLKRQSKDFNGAINDLDASLRLNSKSARTYFEKAMCYYEQKNDEQSVNMLTKAIELNSNYGEAYFYRAYSNKAISKNNEACADIKKAQELKYEKAAAKVSEICK